MWSTRSISCVYIHLQTSDFMLRAKDNEQGGANRQIKSHAHKKFDLLWNSTEVELM